jgi:hypothetical protein
MKVTIEIECDTINDLYAHLGVLQKQIKAQAKKQKRNPIHDDFHPSVVLEDDNCYGAHVMNIEDTYGELGYIDVDSDVKPKEDTEYDVIFDDGTESVLMYWNEHEGWDAQTEPHHIMVTHWKEKIVKPQP